MPNQSAPLSFRLFFGRDVPAQSRALVGSDIVEQAELDAFIADTVAHRLPGWTLSVGFGGWRDDATGALVRERSAILESFGTEADRDTFRAIATAYAVRFGQDSVALVAMPIAGQPEFVGQPEPEQAPEQATDNETTVRAIETMLDGNPWEPVAEPMTDNGNPNRRPRPVDLRAIDPHALGLSARHVLRGATLANQPEAETLLALGFDSPKAIRAAIDGVRQTHRNDSSNSRTAHRRTLDGLIVADAIPSWIGRALIDAADPKY
tara:strand:+ start:39352 stop:40143 length:792 start_codon:yes stop_codon:yes gene_type:complete